MLSRTWIFRSFALSAAGAGALMMAPSAWADASPECNNGLPVPPFITSDNSTECGTQSLVLGDSTSALGAYATAGSLGFGRSRPGYSQPDDLGATAVGAFAFASGTGTVAIGDEAGVGVVAVSDMGGIPFTDYSPANFGTAIGSQSHVTATSGTAIGFASTVSGANAVAIGAGSVADQANTVSVGAVGSERRVVNVAAGTAATDAVNVSQLNAVTGDVSAVQTTVATHTTQITAIETVNSTQATQITALQATDTAFDTRIDALEATELSIASDIDTLFDLRSSDRRDMKQGVAAAMSMANAPMPSAPGRISYAVNGAMFRGEYAVGGSLQYRLSTESPMAVNVGASFAGNKNNGLRVGIAGEF